MGYVPLVTSRQETWRLYAAYRLDLLIYKNNLRALLLSLCNLSLILSGSALTPLHRPLTYTTIYTDAGTAFIEASPGYS
jgi:hypothetical protein